MLTKAELLVAAERAAVYPRGFGYRWGYASGLELLSYAEEAAALLQRDPKAAAFG